MFDLVLGIWAAIGASTLYSLGVALQAVDARRAPAHEHLRLALVRGLLRRARWLAGTGLSMLGFPLQLLALHLAPLVVVQPTLAVGLLVLMAAAQRMLGERPGRREHVAMMAIVLGVLGIALCAPPHSTTHSTEALTITLVLVGLGVASTLPYLLNLLGRPWPSITMIGAGLAFAWSGVATKLASDDLTNGHLVLAGVWVLSTAAASVVGMLSEMSALQSRPAIQVAPLVFVTQTVVPVVLAPLLLSERFTATPLGGVPLAGALALLLAGAAILARSPLLLALMEGERVSDPSGSTPSRSESSQAAMRATPAAEALEPSALTTKTSPARVWR
jgi:drug/metabolite transporter (DMT)-like permease